MNPTTPVESAQVWVLNLDAELELMRPQNYHPTKGSLAACARFSDYARRLLRPDDWELLRSEPVALGCARGYQGRAWCPTPSVLALLDRTGAPISDAPTLTCLQTVNHRSFHAQLGQTLPEAIFSTQLGDVLKQLMQPSPAGWVVKRGFGFASRGVRRMPAQVSNDDVRWLTHALVHGGVQVEPWVPIIAEYSLHGYVTRTCVRIGHPCVVRNGCESPYARANVKNHSSTDDSLSTAECVLLFQQAEFTAQALRTADYTGPFGIDAFAYHWQGMREFNPRSEVNARYTLAYAIGMQQNQT